MPIAGPSQSRSLSSVPLRPLRATPAPASVRLPGQARGVSSFLPKRDKYRVKFKGRIHAPKGASIRGTTLAFGDYGVRVLKECLLTTKTLLSIQESVRRQLRAVRGSNMYFRVFSDIGVAVKGNETKMGKGRGPFAYYHTRVGVGKVVIEIGGPDMEEELAKQILRRACVRIGAPCEIIDKSALPRLGNSLVPKVPAPASGKADAAKLAIRLDSPVRYTATGKGLTAETMARMRQEDRVAPKTSALAA